MKTNLASLLHKCGKYFITHSDSKIGFEQKLKSVALKYDLDVEMNVLPTDTCKRLPSTFEPWEEIVDDLPYLNESGNYILVFNLFYGLRSQG